MTDYGFEDAEVIDVQLPTVTPSKTGLVEGTELEKVVNEGRKLGFVPRAPTQRRKPGPKRKEPQGKLTIGGPTRVFDQFYEFCEREDVTLWEGLERLLVKASPD